MRRIHILLLTLLPLLIAAEWLHAQRPHSASQRKPNYPRLFHGSRALRQSRILCAVTGQMPGFFVSGVYHRRPQPQR